MPIKRYTITIFCLTLMGQNMAAGQNYPSKPIRIFASEAGGNSDSMARLIAPGLAGALGQSVIVENRGGTIIGEQTVASAAPDGYTMIITGSNLWISPLLEKRPYDPVTDFLPVVILQIAPNVLVVHPSLPVKSVKELIALAKTRPGELNYSSGPSGTISHLAAELFNSMAGVKIVRVPYKSGGTAAIGLITGQVQLTILAPATVLPHVKSGRLKALAVTTAQPSALLPGIPTVAASGLNGFEAAEIIGMFAPAKTPASIISRLNQEIVRVVNQAELRETFNAGLESFDRSPEAYAAAIKSSRVRMGKVIKDLGLGEVTK